MFKWIKIICGLIFLSSVVFPLPECYVSKPHCPQRRFGPCHFRGSDHDRLSATPKPGSGCCHLRAGIEKKIPDRDSISRGHPFSSRLSLKYMKSEAAGPDGPAVAVLSAAVKETAGGGSLSVRTAFRPDHHPRAGPLILLKVSFLI